MKWPKLCSMQTSNSATQTTKKATILMMCSSNTLQMKLWTWVKVLENFLDSTISLSITSPHLLGIASENKERTDTKISGACWGSYGYWPILSIKFLSLSYTSTEAAFSTLTVNLWWIINLLCNEIFLLRSYILCGLNQIWILYTFLPVGRSTTALSDIIIQIIKKKINKK